MKKLLRWLLGCLLVIGIITLVFPQILDPKLTLGEIFNTKESQAKANSQTIPVISSYAPRQGLGNSNYQYPDESDDDEDKPDGTYPATVHYYNRNTGYSADYDLEVEVVNGEATTIYWPNGGYSDVDGDPDKEYEVEIEE